MPMVAMWPARAEATASATARRKPFWSRMTWSAANDPIDHIRFAVAQHGRRQPDGRRRVSRFGLEHDVRVGEIRQLQLDRGAVGASGDDHDAVGARERREPIPGVAQQRLAGAREIVEELGRVGARERPQPRSDATGRNHAVETIDRPGLLGHALNLRRQFTGHSRRCHVPSVPSRTSRIGDPECAS